MDLVGGVEVIVYHLVYAVIWTLFFIGATDTFFENYYRAQYVKVAGKGLDFSLILLFLIPAVVEWHNVLIYFFR